MAAQPVRELWDLVKRKLGSTAENVQAFQGDAGQWEVFKAKLLIALDEDPLFREKIQELVTQTDDKTISQAANGSDIQQIGVNRSMHVKISVK